MTRLTYTDQQGLRFATGVADLDFQFDQTTAANFTASGDASVDTNFTQQVPQSK